MTSMVTTLDNPFDPFTEFDEWFNWDMVNGYNTPGLLARLLITSNQLSDADQEADREDAINRLVDLNPNGMLIKVTNET